MGMSMAVRSILLAAVPLALIACEPPPEEAPPPPEPMSEAGATAMRNAFVDTYMRKDVAGASVFYAADAVMYSADGTVHTGKPAIEAALTAMLAAGMDSLGLVSQSFEASGDMATDRGTFIMRTLDPRTKEATRASGNYEMVIGRQADGSFKVVKDSTWIAAAP